MWRLYFYFRPFSWNAFQGAWLKKLLGGGLDRENVFVSLLSAPWQVRCPAEPCSTTVQVFIILLLIFSLKNISISVGDFFSRYWGWYLKSFGCILWRENEGFWMKGANLPGAFTEFFVFAQSVFFIISPSSYPPPSSNQTPAYNKFNTSHNSDF